MMPGTCLVVPSIPQGGDIAVCTLMCHVHMRCACGQVMCSTGEQNGSSDIPMDFCCHRMGRCSCK